MLVISWAITPPGCKTVRWAERLGIGVTSWPGGTRAEACPGDPTAAAPLETSPDEDRAGQSGSTLRGMKIETTVFLSEELAAALGTRAPDPEHRSELSCTMDPRVSQWVLTSVRLGLPILLTMLLVSCTGDYIMKGNRKPATRRERELIKKSNTLDHEAEVLRLLNRCLADYEQGQEYPASLDALGAKATSCAAAQQATPYLDPSFSYRPTRSASSGALDGYTLEVHAKAQPNLRMRTEETGTLYLWFHDRFVPVAGAREEGYVLPESAGAGWIDANGTDAVASDVVRGAETYRRRHPDRGYPDAIAEMNMGGGDGSANVRSGHLDGHLYQYNRLDGYLYQYKPGPREQDGAVHHFRLDVRPVRYGQPWRTSLHVEDGHKWRFTKEDRAAVPTDLAEELLGAMDAETRLAQQAEVLRLLNRCLADYEREKHEYPGSLDALGAKGTRCAAAELAAPHPDPSFSYRPMRSAGSGAPDGYLLGVQAKATPWLRMRTEETGTLYLSNSFHDHRFVPVQGAREEHDVRPESEDWSNLNAIDAVAWDVVDGVETYRRRHPDRGYPATIAEMSDLGGELAVGLRRGRLDGYLYQYKPGPREQDGAVHHFCLDVRPVCYGRPWTTSLHVEDGGGWWSTKEDRAAAPTDRAAPSLWLLPPA
jgi:hypothetical protein